MTNHGNPVELLGAAYPELRHREAEVIVVRGPGRVNLMGEHTDYNAGLVMPAALSLDTRIALLPMPDRRVEFVSTATGERANFDLDAIGNPQGSWIDYVAGVARELMAAGRRCGGARAVISSSVPVSAGLSSSAALELSAAWALLSASGEDPAGACLELALLCQRAENEYVGVACGLMDQFASSCGVVHNALLLDCRSLEYEPVEIPAEIEIVVVDTGVKRRLAASAYNRRRAECQRGVNILRSLGEPVNTLRDATREMLDRAADDLGDVAYRRSRHVVDENGRVAATATALRAADHASLRELFTASHASLRDLYEVSSAELDAAVDIASATGGVIASRMTGAGFGGCTVNLVERGSVSRLVAALETRYRPRSGARATLYEVTAASGAGRVQVREDAAHAGSSPL